MRLIAIWALAFVEAQAAVFRSQHPLLSSNRGGALLEQNARSAQQAAAQQKKPAFGTQWFVEDEQQMAEMPPYAPTFADGATTHQVFNKGNSGNGLVNNPFSEDRSTLPGDPVCDPKCLWACGQSECDQACEPICVPPQCETLCTKSSDKCETRCAKPKCAVLCPTSDCPNGDCPKCRTLCAAPVCTTQCSDDCHSVCSQPQCSWKCKPGNCPKPDCKMSCTGIERCKHSFPPSNMTKVPKPPGQTTIIEGRASLDPTVLASPDPAPPMPDTWKTLPTIHPESSRGYQKVPPAATLPPPVTALRMKWQAEDMVRENERLYRR